MSHDAPLDIRGNPKVYQYSRQLRLCKTHGLAPKQNLVIAQQK